MVNKEQIGSWLAQLEARLKDIEAQAVVLAKTRTDVERQITLLKELLGEGVAAPATGETGGGRFGDILREILEESSHPMHLVEIRNSLSERGVEVPGRGTDANIIAHLRRLPGVYRVGRGTYSTSPPDEGIVASTRRRRRKRRRRPRGPEAG